MPQSSSRKDDILVTKREFKVQIPLLACGARIPALILLGLESGRLPEDET